MRRVIVTGDDFGLSPAVNEAIERAHRDGILSAASLMVGEPGAADAVKRAKRNPGLKVGLHVVVACGRPVLAARDLPDLVGRDGRFSEHLARAGVRYFFLPAARRQLRAEIRAQFEAFRATGLALDHVNAHNHMHLHPTVLSLILEIGRDYGMRALRVPREPPRLSARATGGALGPRALAALFLLPWVELLAWRVRRAGLSSNDYVFGLLDSGAMDSRKVLGMIGALPEGVSEMYFHPTTAPAVELEALIDPAVRGALAERGMRPIAFADLAA